MRAELTLCVRYIISVIQITDIGEGVIVPGTGQARFKCRYTAVVMKPFKGETVDGKVVNVNKMGFFAMVGPLQVFVSSHVSGEFGDSWLELVSFFPGDCGLRMEESESRWTTASRPLSALPPQIALLPPLPPLSRRRFFLFEPLSPMPIPTFSSVPPLLPPLPNVMNAMHRDNRPSGMLIYAGK